MRKFYDQLGREVLLKKPPSRIVSLVPSQTELLVDLGLEDRIVGITRFCVHPAYLRNKKTIVGGPKKVNYDKIEALKPDLILGNKEENTKEMAEHLSASYNLHLSSIASMEETYALIEQYGQIFDVREKAREITDSIKQEEADFKVYISEKTWKKVAYFIWRKPWMVVGGGTFVNHLLTLNHFENVYADIPRYPEVKLEELRGVDFLLLSSEPFPFGEKHRKELKTLLGNHVDMKFINGEYFSWYGSRLEQAFRYFRKWRESEC